MLPRVLALFTPQRAASGIPCLTTCLPCRHINLPPKPNALNPPKGEGLHFYDFPNIKDAKEFKNLYRSRLNELNLDESKRNALITEANYAFRLNMYLFDELQGDAGKGLFKVIVGAIKSKLFGK